MNLLVITQKINKDDPVLGFFHNWIKKISKEVNFITIICLEKGEYDLPKNVKVYSLGKEEGKNRLQILFTFYYLTFSLRHRYDAVFVHMNQEYILLSGVIWKVLGKNIFFWRNHKLGNLFTDISIFLSDRVFYTSSFSYTAKSKKSIKMPVGIDMEIFSPGQKILNTKKILFLGRIAPVKNPDVFIQSLKILMSRNIHFEVDIYGDPLAKDKEFYQSIKRNVIKWGLDKMIRFHKSVPNYKTPDIYRKHSIYVNLTESGSLDKTIFEAISCGSIPIIVNKSLLGQIDKRMVTDLRPESIANSLSYWLSVDTDNKNNVSKKIQKYVSENHSLELLIEKLLKEIKNATNLSN